MKKNSTVDAGSRTELQLPPILDAIASLLEAQRTDLALARIDQELNYQTRTTYQVFNGRE